MSDHFPVCNMYYGCRHFAECQAVGECAFDESLSDKALHTIVKALVDPENQPHQWIGDKDALLMALNDEFAKVFK